MLKMLKSFNIWINICEIKFAMYYFRLRNYYYEINFFELYYNENQFIKFIPISSLKFFN